MNRLIEYLAVTALGMSAAFWVATQASSYTSQLMIGASQCLEDPASCNTVIADAQVRP